MPLKKDQIDLKFLTVRDNLDVGILAHSGLLSLENYFSVLLSVELNK